MSGVKWKIDYMDELDAVVVEVPERFGSSLVCALALGLAAQMAKGGINTVVRTITVYDSWNDTKDVVPVSQLWPMGEDEISAIKCAYADLVGAYQAVKKDKDPWCHDWSGHKTSIHALEEHFGQYIEIVSEEAITGDNGL